MEGIPGLKQGRDACDVAYHGHGKSLGDAFALGLSIAAPAIRKQEREKVLEALIGENAMLAWAGAGKSLSVIPQTFERIFADLDTLEDSDG